MPCDSGPLYKNTGMESRMVPKRLDAWILCLLVGVSLWLFIASESVWYGDAIAYASDLRAGSLIEPGHLLWRPCIKLIEISISRNSSYSAVLWQLQFACLAASVFAVVALYLVASSIYGRVAALVVAALMAVSNGFWTYSFSGCSYSLSLLFTILALRVAVAERGGGVAPARAFLAGLLGGLSSATWGIQLLAAPAIGLAVALTPARDKTSMAASEQEHDPAGRWLCADVCYSPVAGLPGANTLGRFGCQGSTGRQCLHFWRVAIGVQARDSSAFRHSTAAARCSRVAAVPFFVGRSGTEAAAVAVARDELSGSQSLPGSGRVPIPRSRGDRSHRACVPATESYGPRVSSAAAAALIGNLVFAALVARHGPRALLPFAAPFSYRCSA